jgi:ketosteroid isomerase-like protein
MIKKNGFNIRLFVFIIGLLTILSCAKNSPGNTEGVLMQTDSDFSAKSEREGMFSAFLYYIADDGTILRDGEYPAKGKETLRKRFEDRSDSAFILTWEPLFEKISESRDLGYTYGIHTTTVRATGEVTKGTYVTIWQKQHDGSWKFVLDTGTEGLPVQGN